MIVKEKLSDRAVMKRMGLKSVSSRERIRQKELSESNH